MNTTIHPALGGCYLALAFLVLGCGDGASAADEGNGGGAHTGGGNGIPIPPVVGSGGRTGGWTGEPGDPWSLPPGFTGANRGGWLLGEPVDEESGDPGAGTECGTEVIGIVRDFRDSHPDFESYSGREPSRGIVRDQIGADRKPVHARSGPHEDSEFGQQTSGPDNFNEWYRNLEDVNRPYFIHFSFEPRSNGVLTFQSNSFFPLNREGFGNQGRSHNYHFTTELHTEFVYKAGDTFTFTGDDDLWVFINDRLAIDLGGLHPEASQTIHLDELAGQLGIEPGNIYPFDLFHAERHTHESNFRVDTTFEFTSCGIIVDPILR